VAGVVRHSPDIEEGKRTIASVKEVFQVCGLKPADTEAYLSWITRRQKKLEKLAKKINISVPQQGNFQPDTTVELLISVQS
jgi:hypothetical protein